MNASRTKTLSSMSSSATSTSVDQSRILIGINTNKETYKLIQQAQQQQEFPLSHKKINDYASERVVDEIEKVQDNQRVEEGVRKFLEWIGNGKLEIRAYPSENIHAKLYIMSFVKDDRDKGRVITGSSNFTRAGLIDNLEFNVELKRHSDYEFAKQKFEELWSDSVDVSDTYSNVIQRDTWLNDQIMPYQLYLKFLYEYFKDELNRKEAVNLKEVPKGFKPLEYQEQAVINARKIIDRYGGVFLSDVVGLGKTYMSAMLAKQLGGKTLVLAPPKLLDDNNPGSWPSVFLNFGVPVRCESLGKLDKIADHDEYDNIFIDEAHHFRNESNATYEKLATLCREKRVVLVTATPLNNVSKDILSQIKLFQSARKSTIPNVPDLQYFFNQLEKNTKNLDRRKDRDQYVSAIRSNARQIRENVLKHIMVRRTREEIKTYFADDLKAQGLKFPEVRNPNPAYYQLNEQESAAFDRTVEFITDETDGIKYARYTPLLYYKYKGRLDPSQIQSQQNVGGFMKVRLVKRLESSFHAFRRTVARFIDINEQFLREFDKGNVYVSKEHSSKIFELLSNDDDVAIQKLLDDDKATRYPAEDFNAGLRKNLKKDLAILGEISDLWSGLDRDPKLLKLFEMLSNDPVLNKNKLIIFSESKETAEYLAAELEKQSSKSGKVILFTGSSTAATRDKVIENFDANVSSPKDAYRILVTTEVLSEGVNLHRSNVIINYDIPWNPTRLMQRAGRINRVDTKFDEIHSYTFFPTDESNKEIKLKEIAEAKIQAFITLLGTDAKLLTDEETVESHELFSQLNSSKTLTGESEAEQEVSELKYLQVIREIRKKRPNLFEEIKKLPKKARTAKLSSEKPNRLITYFRRENLQKFFIVAADGAEELDFISTAGLLESEEDEPRQKMPTDFYTKLKDNSQALEDILTERDDPPKASPGGNLAQVLKFLKAAKDFRQYTEEQEKYYKAVMDRLQEEALPRQTVNNIKRAQDELLKEGGVPAPLKVLDMLKGIIPDELLKPHFIDKSANNLAPKEVILSEYLVGE